MNTLSNKIIELIENARQQSLSFINFAMVNTYYQIGKLIVEEIQEGKQRANYGKSLLKQASKELAGKLGRGFSVQNLENMRLFYTTYSPRIEKSQSLIRNFNKKEFYDEKSQSLIRNFDENDFNLSWTHYLILIRIANEKERLFYEIEAINGNWSVRELQRQFNSSLYERLVLSSDKSKVRNLSEKGHIIEKPQDIIKEPLILEFLGLEDKPSYSETELETAIINQIEKFMLELGKGFFFGGRQVRFTFDEENFFVDLVFYNRLLKCFVLIDLKLGKLKHQDIGQMQMYINYYDRYIKNEDENPTIGILVCKDKNQAIIEITLPENNKQIFATKYQTILPSKKQLKELIEKRIE
jgi:predicted nuclease of restriction endonuclease-like (RecB) superfamily